MSKPTCNCEPYLRESCEVCRPKREESADIRTESVNAGPRPREWWTKLDGVAGVNLAEPSPGDLERVTKAYAECRAERDAWKASAELKDAILVASYDLFKKVSETARMAIKERDGLRVALERIAETYPSSAQCGQWAREALEGK